MTDIFGNIVTGTELEAAVITTLESWFPVYIREVELQSQASVNGEAIPTDALPLPKSFLTADRVDREAADKLPSIVVVSPGLSGRNTPKQNGDGTFLVPWGISIGAFVSGKDRTSTKRLVRVYLAVCRLIMLQKQALGGLADGTVWLDESYDDTFAFVDDQTISAGTVIFEVWVDNVAQRYGGPATYGGPDPQPDPGTQPGSDWPVVETVEAIITTEE